MLNEIYQNLDPVAFSLGPLVVRWYGLAYVLGFALAAFVIYRVAKRWRLGMTEDDLLTLMVCAIIGVVLGARAGYVLFYGDGYYFAHPLEIFAFNQGGMSFHGGLAGLLAGGAVAARLTEIPFLTLADLGAIAAPLGLFFGRCANFVNGELWGAPTDWPIGVVFGGAAGMMPRHPSQLYEAVLEGLVIFCVLFALSRKMPPRPRGTFVGAFLLLYGVFRFLIEFVREPDAQLGYLWGGWLTMGQVLSAPLVIAGVAMLVYAAKRKLPQEGPRRFVRPPEPLEPASPEDPS
ncbi:prolipoprotein diacylglyceryl transferase [Adlercreutzia caecimuris]|jgi:phosphatidylglycerol:prolipoprotein diacylglycerol transferase|uniref:Phosphatidylglycerol--prolipoprotein diacylglyceryl transferase n=2 Tax=Adlercreutzia caecimuris TaxID=671266 RepID=R9KYS1_9ACTN|nr:prolipoprotein diacylglyceryl transferase [Adlercreutzia caecimuris]MCI9673588.1 prolipoprotein diacylglyceryl transferase [Enterorhabdus sp.]EOS51438.1 prolipoprotein diacylglyceryl transferase [Adlercreutzia caecimuris B7]MCI9207595.1 prolipoprotein diacylglyceryl transferase [Adlercreutzia caecimuris]NBJ66849.1 prolipoprotein diacylglyceryl transferase [Adlercreutzia caecimuris]THG37492.1 prolipoprotein diacylglyceryl transferase [Adlercreutzia caecimuris]